MFGAVEGHSNTSNSFITMQLNLSDIIEKLLILILELRFKIHREIRPFVPNISSRLYIVQYE